MITALRLPSNLDLNQEIPILQAALPPTVTPAMFLSHKPPTSLPSLKVLEVQALFEQWYTQDLFAVTVTSSVKEEVETMKQVIAYSKCLLPPNSKIEAKPSDAAALQTWQHNIRELSKTVQQRWLQLRVTYEKDRKKPIRKAPVWSVKKLIPQIERVVTEEAFRELFPFPNITDHITPPEFRWENFNHRKYKRQRIY